MSPGDPPGPEPVFRPEWPVVDAHHHLWDGHLRGSGITVDVPVYEADALLADLASGHDVIATVAVESFSHYAGRGPAGETAFADAVARSHPGICNAIVGWADLRDSGVASLIAAHEAASPRFRGVRHSAAWDADPGVSFPTLASYTAPGMMADPAFRAGVRLLGERNLVFETFILHPQLGEAADLAAATPDTTIVIDHTGMPLALGRYAGRPDEVRTSWQAGLARLSRLPNVRLKLGGLAMRSTVPGSRGAARSSDELADRMKPWMDCAIDLFGAGRCLFESNFPVERSTVDYRTLWNAFKKLASDHGDADAAALLSRTALGVYRLHDGLAGRGRRDPPAAEPALRGSCGRG